MTNSSDAIHPNIVLSPSKAHAILFTKLRGMKLQLFNIEKFIHTYFYETDTSHMIVLLSFSFFWQIKQLSQKILFCMQSGQCVF
jgi:hypothetical protein